jgi:hypothetical protein
VKPIRYLRRQANAFALPGVEWMVLPRPQAYQLPVYSSGQSYAIRNVSIWILVSVLQTPFRRRMSYSNLAEELRAN